MPTSAGRHQRSAWLLDLALMALLLIVAVALLRPTWSGPFIYDDLSKIRENADLQRFDALPGILFAPYAEHGVSERNDPSRPLVYLVYMLIHRLAGLDPSAFHAVNTLLHGMTAALLYLLAKRLLQTLPTVPPVAARSWAMGLALSAALVWLLLPINTGVAVYAYGLSDVLSAGLLTAVVLVAGGRQPVPLWRTLAALVLMTLALAAKQSAIVLPLLLLILDGAAAPGAGAMSLRDWWSLGRGRWPFWALALAYMAFRAWHLGGIGDLEAKEALPYTWPSYLGVQGLVIWKYVRLALWPSGLTIDHVLFPEDFTAMAKTMAWLALAVLGVVAARDLRAKQAWRRALALGWLIMLVALLPTSSVLPTVDCMVERRFYLASFGLVFAAGSTLQAMIARHRLIGVLLAGSLAFAYGFESWRRNQVFADYATVITEALQVEPRNYRLRANLGLLYLERGNLTAAKAEFESLLAAAPPSATALIGLAMIYEDAAFSGYDPRRARELYQEALRLEPNAYSAAYNAGRLAFLAGDLMEAERLFNQALAVNPTYTPPMNNLALLRLSQGRLVEARALLEEALRLDPGFDLARRSLERVAAAENGGRK